MVCIKQPNVIMNTVYQSVATGTGMDTGMNMLLRRQEKIGKIPVGTIHTGTVRYVTSACHASKLKNKP